MSKKGYLSGAYLEKQHNVYYAVYTIPVDIRHAFGKTKFHKTTRTSDRYTAARRAAALVFEWKAQVHNARANSQDPLINEAKELRHLLKVDRSITGLVDQVIEERVTEIAIQAGDCAAESFNAIARGERVVLADCILGWRQTQECKNLKKKTLDQQERDIQALCSTYPFQGSFLAEKVEKWIEVYAQEQELTPSTVIRLVGSCKSFFHYLQDTKVLQRTDTNPFIVPKQFRKTKSRHGPTANRIQSWQAFKPAEIVRLYECAQSRNDLALASLILIASYTGARIEEICSLRCDQVNLSEYFFDIQDAKTDAGVRCVPIHTKIRPLISKLLAASKDGYLLPGLTSNKYGDRSNAVGKRFGRLKSSEGFGDLLVFHSIRKTFTTQLENLCIQENLAADIVGHEKPRITYGLYSGGASLEVKADAIEKVTYPFPNFDPLI